MKSTKKKAFVGFRELQDDLVIHYHSHVDAVDEGPIYKEDHTFWRVSMHHMYSTSSLSLDCKEIDWVLQLLAYPAPTAATATHVSHYIDVNGYHSLQLTRFPTYDGPFCCFQRLDHQYQSSRSNYPKSFIIAEKVLKPILTRTLEFPRHPRF